MKTRIEGLLVWLKSATDQQVADTGTTRPYLRLIGYGHKTASVGTAALIEKATNGAATRQQLRPDDWHVMWPELDCSQASSGSQSTQANSSEAAS